MRKLSEYGPSLVVLATVALVLFAGPAAVRNLTFARTEAKIEQASNRLRDDNIFEVINQAHRDIAVKVAPSVVYISTQQIEQHGRFGSDSRTRLSSGSGWVFDEDGHIVTNAHVIEGAERIDVQLNDGQTYRAKTLGTDLRTDIAVLKVTGASLHAADRTDADSLEQGDTVFAFGSPFDFRFSMSQGIVSGVGRDAQLADVRYQNFIQVDAAINPGNSGGPLANIYGEVIGMNTAIATGKPGSMNDGVFSGIGLAIPMEMIEAVVSQIIETGEVSRGFVGVEMYRNSTDGSARLRGFTGEGVEIKNVTPNGPAYKAGLKVNDVITHVNGRDVATVPQVRAMISSYAPDETIEITVWRFDRTTDQPRTLDLAVTLAEMDPEILTRPGVRAFLADFGFAELETSTPRRAAELGVEYHQGVLVEAVNRGSSADGVIGPGSIITEVFDQRVRNLDEFYARIDRIFAAMPRGVNVTIYTPEGSQKTVTLQPYGR